MILLLNYYNSSNAKRNEEIEFALKKNIETGLFDEIILLYEPGTLIPPKFIGETREILFSQRPTYKEMISLLQKDYSNQVCVITNADIFFDKTLNLTKHIDYNKYVVCLSRYECDPEKDTCIRRDDEKCMFSQDTWIINSSKKYDLEEANFTMGVPRCDGRIAFLFEKSGYCAVNPCLTVRSYHCHTSGIRNYICGVHFVKGDIQTVKPSLLNVSIRELEENE